jgi:hypothetical protein
MSKVFSRKKYLGGGWLTAVGLGEYVQVVRGMFVKLGITGKESSAFGSFTFPFGEGKRGGSRFKFNFNFLGGGHFKYYHAKEAKSRNKQPNIIHRLTNNTMT